MPRTYGTPSRRMLSFLNEKPGATSTEINDHLFNNRVVDELQISWRYNSAVVTSNALNKTWVPASIIRSYFTSGYYKDVQIIGARKVSLSKVCRGKFAYLLSPYHSRTMASDSTGINPHPRSVNVESQRCWFWRKKINNRYRYFLTLKGMAAVEKYGLD